MPAKKKIDKTTEAYLSKGELISSLVKSDGWVEAKKILMGMLSSLDSISQIPQGSVEDRIREIDVRSGVVSIILKWISDVEGASMQHEQLVETLAGHRNDEFVRIYSPDKE